MIETRTTTIVKDSYTLMLGNCLERMREIPDGSVDMVLADLPYGTTACKWDVILPFDVLWEHYWRVLKPDGVAVLFCNQPFTTILIQSALKQYKYSWIWHKRFAGNFTLAKKQPLRVTEEIAVFGRGGVSYAPQMTQREQPIKMGKNIAKSGSANLAAAKAEYDGKVYDQKYPENILYFSNREEKQRFHPTQKPVPLLEYLIRTYTQAGQLILDNTMGSGSTGVAALQTGRRFVGVEKEPAYFEVAARRLAEARALDVPTTLLKAEKE